MGMGSMILKYKMAQGNAYKVTNCISTSLLLLVVILYVDDRELLRFHIAVRNSQNVLRSGFRHQSSVTLVD